MTESNKHYSAALDCCRWIAAFLVLVGHVRHMLLADFDVLAHKSLMMKSFYFITGVGDEAVVVFFVLSGLLVGGSAAKKFLEGRYDAREYAVHRISRIYTVLIPALIVGGMLDIIGVLYFNGSQIYTHPHLYPTIPVVDVTVDNLTMSTFMGNVLMTQHWLVPVFGSNGPLWSLTSEWWFYCLFWAMLGAASANRTRGVRLAYGATAIVMAAVLPAQVLLWFSIWLLGAAMAFVDRTRLRIPPAVGLCVFGAVLVGIRLMKSANLFEHADPLMRHYCLDVAIAGGYCVLLAALCRIRSFRLGPHRFHQAMAGFSYTTYLAHMPMMVFLSAFAYSCFGIRFAQQPGPFVWAYLLATVALLYLYSYAFSRMTERNTAWVRRLLERWSTPPLHAS